MKDYSKGSRRRPPVKDEKKFSAEWDRIFGTKKEPIDKQKEKEENPYGRAD